MTISPGRLNNATAALHTWFQVFTGHGPSHNDVLVFGVYAEQVLRADDRYLTDQSKVPDDRLRVHHAKGLEKIRNLAGRIERMRERVAAVKAREAAADRKLAEADETLRRARAWQFTADAYARDNQALRARLTALGADPDRPATAVAGVTVTLT